MTKLRTLALLLPMFLFAACGSEAGAAGNADAVASTAESVTKVLTGITDGKTAEAAKPKLEELTGKLSTALSSLKSMGENAGSDAKGALGDLAKKAAGAISPELTKSLSGITEQITRLMGNAEIVKAIGPMLEKLKGVLPQ